MPGILRSYVVHDFWLKLLSVALATWLWHTIAVTPRAVVEVTVPIEFHNLPANLNISSERIPQAEIRVSGPARLVREIKASDLHAEIDLANASTGERTVDLTAQLVHTPREIRVEQILPSQVHISLDRRQLRDVQIQPRVVGSFAQGYRIARVLSEPAWVTISGPKQRVDAVGSATTDPIDASGTMTPTSFTTHAYVADPLVQVVNPVPVHVTVIMEKVEPPAASTAK